MKRSQINEQYPCFFAFGRKHKFLSSEEASNATVEDRIRSIWPFIVHRVLAFHASLKPRDRVNYDPEDVLIEVVIVLLENDKKWTPERGKYITYAGCLIGRHLFSIRDKARTVESPRNSSCRLREYETQDEDGTLTERCRKTREDIKRTRQCLQPIHPRSGLNFDKLHLETPLDTAIIREKAYKSKNELADAVASALTPQEAMILGRTSGIWGRKPEDPWLVAFKLNLTASSVRAINARAIRKLKDHLETAISPQSV